MTSEEPPKVDLKYIFDIYSDLKQCRISGHVERCGLAKELNDDGIKTIDDFIRFWNSLLGSRRMGYYVITRDQSYKLLNYLMWYNVRFENDGKKISVVYERDFSYDGRTDYTIFYRDDSFKCVKCGAAVEIFEKECEHCLEKDKNDGFDAVI
jgi:hypothetical protein